MWILSHITNTLDDSIRGRSTIIHTYVGCGGCGGEKERGGVTEITEIITGIQPLRIANHSESQNMLK